MPRDLRPPKNLVQDTSEQNRDPLYTSFNLCNLWFISFVRIFGLETMALGFCKDLLDRFGGKPVDWDELEESLIRADIGVPMTLRIIGELQQRQVKITAKDVVEVTRRHIEQILPIANPKLRPLPNRPKV